MNLLEWLIQSEPDADHTWRTLASCIDAPVDFLTARKHVEIRTAKGICHNCAVLSDCLAYAQASNQVRGIWGGLTASERRSLQLS